MIKFGLVLGAALATLAGVAAIISFCLFLTLANWWEWLIRLAVSLLLLAFVHLALPVLHRYLPPAGPTKAESKSEEVAK